MSASSRDFPGTKEILWRDSFVSRESARSKLGIRADEYVLGIVSRIRSERKVVVAVEAFGIAQKKLRHLRLVIMGRGKQRNIESGVLEPARRFGMESRVIHLGYLKGQSYVEELAATDAGIYLNPGSDKSCRTVLEFMAMGKPPIVGKQGILSGLVEDAENGLEVDRLQFAQAKNATKVIPIVMAHGSDPVELGYVASLARPGGNITGLTHMAPELGGKRLELLKDIIAHLSRVAVLTDPGTGGHSPQIKELEVAAPALGLHLRAVEV